MKALSAPVRCLQRETLFVAFLAMNVLSAGGLLAALLWALYPTDDYRPAGPLARFATAQTPQWVSLDGQPVYIVQAGGALLALDPAFVRDGRSCRVIWDGARQQFDDPCWGAKFNRQGRCLAGPCLPGAGLRRHPVEVRAGELWVDRNRALASAQD